MPTSVIVVAVIVVVVAVAAVLFLKIEVNRMSRRKKTC